MPPRTHLVVRTDGLLGCFPAGNGKEGRCGFQAALAVTFNRSTLACTPPAPAGDI